MFNIGDKVIIVKEPRCNRDRSRDDWSDYRRPTIGVVATITNTAGRRVYARYPDQEGFYLEPLEKFKLSRDLPTMLDLYYAQGLLRKFDDKESE